jgi:hypothetical protein
LSSLARPHASRAIFLVDAGRSVANASDAKTIRYRVRPAVPHEHLFEVECRFPASAGPLDLWMPVWTPGSYLVREYARHVQGFEASDGEARRCAGARGQVQPGACTRRAPGGGGPLPRLLLDLTVRTNHLEASHGYFNGAALFLTSEGAARAAVPARARPARGWRASCALPAEAGAFSARDYDELIDSPVEMGRHVRCSFTAAGKPHEIALWGDGAALDRAALAPPTSRRSRETRRPSSAACPSSAYLFILHLTDKGRGGLEHAAPAPARPALALRPAQELRGPAGAGRPRVLPPLERQAHQAARLVPFDYRRESYTTLLWAMEGITSYYDTLVLRRAGLIDAARYLARLGEVITTVESQPGRRAISLAEASRLAWIKHYRPDENTPNSGISYYAKGEVVAALLDLELRRRSSGERSLDDLMRLLFERYGDGKGVPEDAWSGRPRTSWEASSRLFDGASLADDADYGSFAHVGWPSSVAQAQRQRQGRRARRRRGRPGQALAGRGAALGRPRRRRHRAHRLAGRQGGRLRRRRDRRARRPAGDRLVAPRPDRGAGAGRHGDADALPAGPTADGGRGPRAAPATRAAGEGPGRDPEHAPRTRRGSARSSELSARATGRREQTLPGPTRPSRHARPRSTPEAALAPLGASLPGEGPVPSLPCPYLASSHFRGAPDRAPGAGGTPLKARTSSASPGTARP